MHIIPVYNFIYKSSSSNNIYNMRKFKRYLESGNDDTISERTLRRSKRNNDNLLSMPFSQRDSELQNVQLNEVQNKPQYEHLDNVKRINNEFIESVNSENCIIFADINRGPSSNLKDYDNCLNSRDENMEVRNLPKSSNYKNIHDFMSNENFHKKISIPVDITLGEMTLMILKYSVANSLSLTALTNLLKLFNTMFAEPVLPDSQYFIDKILNKKSDAEFHAVCPNCSNYVGKYGELQVNNCSSCNVALNLSTPSNHNFFITIDPSDQISDLLQIHKNYYDYVVNKRQHYAGRIKDIYDGKLYREFVKSLPKTDKHKYVSLTFNTDGAQKFKCSKYSIWPMFLMINEIPPQDRLKNLIVCGLWFNKNKPNMPVFLEQIVDVINKLSENGIQCTFNEQVTLIKPYVLECCVDSVARAPMQGIKQFNGNYGCSWCLHPGVFSGGSIRYSLLEDVPEPRDKERTIGIMLRVKPRDPILGIKHISPLINLYHFDIIKGFDPEYLHSCLEGVEGQITERILQNLSERIINTLDSKLESIAVPHQISRLPRSLKVRNDWKAREWENFILYYSAPLFSKYIDKQIFDYWLLFVESLYILLKKDIDILELDRADKMLHEFVGKTEQYFGINAMTYNVHLMLHISSSVLNWGPLWAHSTFPFESRNYQLLRAVKCAKGVPQQILRFVNINHSILILSENVSKEASNEVRMYCSDTLYAKVKYIARISNITYLGRGYDVDVDVMNNLHLSEYSKSYERIIKNGCLYTASVIQNRRTNDSFAQLNDNRFIKINCFLIDEGKNYEHTLCQIVQLQDCYNRKYRQMQKVISVDERIISIPTNDIYTICVYIKIDDEKYICRTPNLLHY